MTPPSNRRLTVVLLFVLALAALVWSGLRLMNTARDHDAPTAASAPAG